MTIMYYVHVCEHGFLLLEGRNLADVRTQMKQKLDLQHYIQQEAEDMQLNMLGEEIQKRVDIADAKRRNRLETLQQQMRNKNSIEFSNWSKRAIGLENEAKKRKREDRLKQLSVSLLFQSLLSLPVQKILVLKNRSG